MKVNKTINLKYKINPENIENMDEVLKDFIYMDDILHISVDKYFEDENYKYFMLIATLEPEQDAFMSKLLKIRKGNKYDKRTK